MGNHASAPRGGAARGPPGDRAHPAPRAAHMGHYQLPEEAREAVWNELRPPKLLSLRPEVLRAIIEFAPELLPLSAVCRAFFLASQDDRLWRLAFERVPWCVPEAPLHGWHCEGLLDKYVNLATGTRPRWCAVNGSVFLYHNSVEEAVANEPPRKVLQLPCQTQADENTLQLRLEGMATSPSSNSKAWAHLCLTLPSLEELLRWQYFVGAAGRDGYELPGHEDYRPSDLQHCCWKQQTMQRYRGALEAGHRQARRDREAAEARERWRSKLRVRVEKIKDTLRRVEGKMSGERGAAKKRFQQKEAAVAKTIRALVLVVAAALLCFSPVPWLLRLPGRFAHAVEGGVCGLELEAWWTWPVAVARFFACWGLFLLRLLAYVLPFAAFGGGAATACADECIRRAKLLPAVHRRTNRNRRELDASLDAIERKYRDRIAALKTELEAAETALPRPQAAAGGGGGFPCVIS